MKKYPLLLITALFLAGPSLISCGENTSESDVIHVESVTLTGNTETLKVGEQLQLLATVLPSTASDKTVTFEASNDNAEVSDSGVVTAKKAGASVITATSHDGGKKASLTLQIVEDTPETGLSATEYAEKLSESAYTDLSISSKEKYGLGSSAVGVNQDLIVEKYGKVKDSEVDMVFETSAITLEQVKAYFPDAEKVNHYYQIQTAILLAKKENDAAKKVKIRLPESVVDIDASLSDNTSVFVLQGLDGTYFEGNGTVLRIKILDLDYKGYFTVTDCRNIYFNDITLDQEIPSSLTGRIVEGDAEKKTMKIAIDEEFNPLVEELLLKKKNIRSWVEFGQINKTPLEGGNFLVDSFSDYQITKTGDGIYQMEVSFAVGINRSRNGTLVSVQFSQYDARGISVTGSENVYFENVTMHHAYGMAFVSSDTKNLYLNRFNLSLKEGSSSLMTATADALHFDQMSGEVVITNSILENSHDDALNIKHGYWYKLNSAEGGSTRTMTVSKLTSAVNTPKVGDHIAVYNEETFESHNPSAGYYTISEVETTVTGFLLHVKERMSDVINWGNCRVTFLSDTPKLTFTNNIIRNKRNRGILIQVPEAVVENNAFMNIGHGSIQVASAMDKFNEATLAQNVTIRNNKFINNCTIKPEPLYGDISIFAISNNASVAPKSTLYGAKIENNFIAHNGNAAVSMRGVGSSDLKDNLFYNCSYTQPSGDKFNTILQAVNCENITLSGNYNQYTLNKGLSGITLEGNSSESDVTIEDTNYNISFKKNEDAGPEVDVGKLTKKITLDGDLSDWENAGYTNIDIIGVSDAEGTQRSQDELSGHFKANKLYLSYDDEGIYFAVDIFDDKLDVRTINDFWLGDCVELFMSTVTDLPNADMQIYKNQGGVLQAAFAPTWKNNGYCTFSEVRTNPSYVSNKDKMQASFVTKSDGYTGEFIIPFTLAPEFKKAIEEGKRIDMAFVVADAERSDLGLKRVQMGNIPHFVEDYKTKTARMTQYLFK